MNARSSVLKRFQANRAPLFFNLILAIVISAIIGPTVALHHNVLNAHPHWISSKTQLDKGVMGALAFVSLQQSLAGNKLNLGAWFGYNEVLQRKALNLSSLSLNFRLEERGYLHVLYDHRESGYSGLRFSTMADFPNIQYSASPSSEFQNVRDLNLKTPVSAGPWHEVRLEFSDDSTSVILNGELVGQFERTSGSQRIGFRGSQRNTWVDDVVLTSTEDVIFREDFANHDLALPATLACLALLVMVAFIAIVLLPQRESLARRMALWLAMSYTVLIVAATVAYVTQSLTGRAYPGLTKSSLEIEDYWINSSYGSILNRLKNRYGSTPAGETHRVVFIGSSQTWGAGALTESDTWVRQTEQLLNGSISGVRFECINGGVSGLTSGQMLKLLRNHLLKFRPQSAVFNLGNNDTDPAELGKNFKAILDLLEERKVRSVLLLEANSTEKLLTDSRHGDLFEKHRVLSDLAQARGVTVINMHEHLAGLRDTGFLWWDFSHLTSYGQQLFAEHLQDQLLPILVP